MVAVEVAGGGNRGRSGLRGKHAGPLVGVGSCVRFGPCR